MAIKPLFDLLEEAESTGQVTLDFVSPNEPSKIAFVKGRH